MQAYKLLSDHNIPGGKEYMDLDEQSQNLLSDKWGPQVLVIVNEELIISSAQSYAHHTRRIHDMHGCPCGFHL